MLPHIILFWLMIAASEANSTFPSSIFVDDCLCEKGDFCYCDGKLSISDSPIKRIKNGCLNAFPSLIEELTMEDLENFEHFESKVFQGQLELETIYIKGAPRLLWIGPEVFDVSLPKLKILRIVDTGLLELPNLNNLVTDNILHMIDLERNHIRRIGSNQLTNIHTGQLVLNFNDLESVEAEAFSGSQIAKLSLRGNINLVNLDARAFAGIKDLREIDLSSTSITFLPTDGLREIDVLKVQDTKSLKVFPSVYNFKNIEQAWLTYPYHCCAFKFPQTHNPWEYDKHKKLLDQYKLDCNSKNATQKYMELIRDRYGPSFAPLYALNQSYETSFSDDSIWLEEEVFHNNTKLNQITLYCGDTNRNYHKVKCYPSPDAFNPCEDLMGNWSLRIPVWFISLSAVVGNLFVIVVISTSHFRLTVSKFLMCNLAAADLCIGIHLLLIAIVDACSVGVYFNYAIDWQEGNGCKVAGFLTVFGNVLSVYTLAVITTERWYTITWAIHLNRRLKLRTAVRVMFVGWICAIIMAILPLIGISNYSKTSICLPLENRGKLDVIYLSTLLSFNALAFALIVVCYGSMYRSIREGGNTCSVTCVRSDLTVAKRMALLVFTDFACWAPIAFFGLTALLGYPLITVPQTKILLVFFYPLNSCANPCLYALLTQQYRRDFFILMGRYGLCKDRAEIHKGAIGGKPLPYGAGKHFKRTNFDSNNQKQNTSARSSVLTTVVSVEVPIARTTAASRCSSYKSTKQDHTCKLPLYNFNSATKTNDASLISNCGPHPQGEDFTMRKHAFTCTENL